MKIYKENRVKNNYRELEDQIRELRSKLAEAENTILYLKSVSADAKLEIANQKINEILNSIEDDFYVLDCEWKFLYVSKKFTSKFGKTPDDMLGRNFWELFPKYINTEYEKNLREAMEIREIRRFEIAGKYTDSFYKLAIFPSAEGVTVLGTDITELRKTELALLENEKHKAYLLGLSDAIRTSSDSREIKEIALKKLGETLRVTRSGYAEVLPDETCILVEESFVFGKPLSPGVFRLEDYGPRIVPFLRSGKTIIENNIYTNDELSEVEIQAYIKLSVRSQVIVPLIKNDRLCAILGVSHSEPRNWSENEILIVEETAERTWVAAERARFERELIESKENYQNVLEAIQESIYLFNDKGIVVFANSTAARRLNLKPEEVIGHHFSELLLPEIVPEIQAKLDYVFNTGNDIHIEDSREDIVFEHCFFPFFKNNRVEYVATYSHNITARKKSERELIRLNEDLRRAEDKLEFALESGNIGVWEWNLETNEFVADKRIEQIIGVDINSFKDKQLYRKYINEEDLPHVDRAFKRAIQTGEPIDTIVRIKKDRGELKFLNIKAQVRRKEDKTASMIGVCLDITEMQKNAEIALFKVNEELLRSNRELQQFAYIASHDLQEPLRMVSSFTQLLEERYREKLDQDANEFIHFAVEGSKRMQQLINDLLAFSRIQTKGKEFQPTDMNIILEKAISNLSVKINETQAKVSSDKLPVIYADDSQMIQVIQNLIINGIKFNKRVPEIHISCKEEPNRYVFSVRDNGIGIEAEYFDKIFNIFQRLSVKEEYEGTGIGLSICKRIVERHGGSIWLESEFGKGSTFNFSISKF